MILPQGGGFGRPAFSHLGKTVMNIFTVAVACYDSWNEQTLVVAADSVEDACTKAIDIADGERVYRYQRHSWAPGVTFVAGIAEGGDPDDNDAPEVFDTPGSSPRTIGGSILFEHSDEAAFGADVLLDVLKAALPELESALAQREHSGNGETAEPLQTIVTQVGNAIAGGR
jgi:hypothetical protein